MCVSPKNGTSKIRSVMPNASSIVNSANPPRQACYRMVTTASVARWAVTHSTDRSRDMRGVSERSCAALHSFKTESSSYI